jgi:hydrogenase-4 component F
MVLVMTVRSMGMMWVAVEATTLASVFLVGFYGDQHAIEAAWKYIIICSVGIAIAMLGIVFLHIASIDVLDKGSYLNWTALYENAEKLNKPMCRLAFIFLLVGFGTKAGLAPMHTWLPDAHSQAPSPVSALLSGVLLNTAMYGIIRSVAIFNKTLGDSRFTGTLLVASGLLSIVTAAVFIFMQKDFKRLLAYSSIEHMGIIALALGVFTPLSVFGALFHMINHSITKSMLFLTSGSLLHKYKTKQIDRITGVLKLLPVSGTVFFLGLLAIAGTPPFGVFASELSVLKALFDDDRLLTGILTAILLALVFAGMAYTIFEMFLGDPPPGTKAGEYDIVGLACLILLMSVALAFGLFMPVELKALLESAAQIVMGG